jgi:hypothetical protein
MKKFSVKTVAAQFSMGNIFQMAQLQLKIVNMKFFYYVVRSSEKATVCFDP